MFQRIESLEATSELISSDAIQRARDYRSMTEMLTRILTKTEEDKKAEQLSQMKLRRSLAGMKRSLRNSNKKLKEHYASISDLLITHANSLAESVKQESGTTQSEPSSKTESRLTLLETLTSDLMSENKTFDQRLTELENKLTTYLENMDKRLEDIPTLVDLDARLKMLAESLVGLDKKWSERESNLQLYVDELFLGLEKKFQGLLNP